MFNYLLQIYYQDTGPCLIINESSIVELNSRLDEKEKINFQRFRPTIVIDGHQAYEEDRWKEIIINDYLFVSSKPCTRCVLTTVDPDTGTKSKQNEPLKTLRRL